MTHEELRAVAARRGFIKWKPSGIVEKTRIVDDVIHVRGVIPYHYMKPLVPRDSYRCREATRRQAWGYRRWLTQVLLKRAGVIDLPAAGSPPAAAPGSSSSTAGTPSPGS